MVLSTGHGVVLADRLVVAQHRGMPVKRVIPSALLTGPFTTGFAANHGVTVAVLGGPQFVRLFRGVYVSVRVPLTLHVWIAGALLVLPKDAVVSHITALWVYGIEIGPQWPLHFSTNTLLVSRHRALNLHRRIGRLSEYRQSGIPVLGPDRTLVDSSRSLSVVQWVQAAEMMINRQFTTLEALWEFVLSQHIDGILRARRVLLWVREGAESPMETVVRLMIMFARMPEPEPNRDIFDDNGNFVARGDLTYPVWKVLIEYDGWQHERDGKQRQRDRERREVLEGLGWRVIVVTFEDMRRTREVVWRVHAAIEARGYAGPAPLFNSSWDSWFATI